MYSYLTKTEQDKYPQELSEPPLIEFVKTLNWKFSKGVDVDTQTKLIENISGEYFKNVMEIAQRGTGGKLAQDLSDFFGKEEYENLKIELIDLLHPFFKRLLCCTERR